MWLANGLFEYVLRQKTFGQGGANAGEDETG
jgi:hypothetical protein